MPACIVDRPSQLYVEIQHGNGFFPQKVTRWFNPPLLQAFPPAGGLRSLVEAYPPRVLIASAPPQPRDPCPGNGSETHRTGLC